MNNSKKIIVPLFCILMLGCTVSPAAYGDATTPPNIVFIMADDLGYGDLGSYGQTKIRTPHLDTMAAEGMQFTQYYSGSTVCAPARCVLMTGLHTGHALVRGNEHIPLRDEDYTVAELLKDAGYATGLCGKWGIGEPGTSGVPNKQGFDFFYGYLNQRNAHFYYPPFLWRNEEKVMLDGNDADKQTGRYSHDLIAEEALGFVRDNADKPFFLYWALTIPHAELAVPEDSLAEYRGEFPETPFPKAHYGAQPTPHAAHAAMVSRMDRDVGRLMALLKDLGIDDNTIVFFTSDNGPHKEGGHDPDFFDSNGPLRGTKRDLYEGGIRVPLIVRWPERIAAGTTNHHIGAFWDFLPTAAGLASHDAPKGLDGLSMVPTLLGDSGQKEHDHLYWEFYEQGGKQAVRQGNWKGIRLNARRKPDGPIELYNLDEDLGETADVAMQHPRIVKRLTRLMNKSHTPNENYSFK
ncbi:MAG: arylsulfatase [Candidatus Hydrogenedentota bacterium]|nr:MAG: arylsulfatase [Candidatus Hydrogenedentota bacterium]